jgi:riboflavin-specific deaminase-like protein
MIRRIWPDPTQDLDDADLVAAYTAGDRSTPRVRMNFAMSLDGAIAVEGRSKPLSSPEDRELMAALRMLCDVLLVGAGTLRDENMNPFVLSPERREWRRSAGLAEYPPLAVVSGSLDLSPDHRALAKAPVRPLIITHELAPADRRAGLSEVADIVVAGHSTVDADRVVAALVERGLPQVLCEGGPTLLSAFIAADRVDEMCLAVSPRLAGAHALRMHAGVPTPELRHLVPKHVLLADDGMLYLLHGRP